MPPELITRRNRPEKRERCGPELFQARCGHHIIIRLLGHLVEKEPRLDGRRRGQLLNTFAWLEIAAHSRNGHGVWSVWNGKPRESVTDQLLDGIFRKAFRCVGHTL